MSTPISDLVDNVESFLEPESPTSIRRVHDVFLSFRGEHTRASFTSHLHTSLQNAGFNVFKDDDSLERGEHISASQLRAIEESRISVIVFSRNYAHSRWCMEELVKIMKCHRTIGQVVLPVFYDVDPSEVRRQTGEFGDAFQNLVNRVSYEGFELVQSVLGWRNELREAGGLAGFVVQNSRSESEVIKDIVGKVTHLLDKTDLFIADNPVGVERRVQDMKQLLHLQRSDDVLLLGMWGMGGIGKTTIAKAIYNEIGRDFEGRSFLANIREIWEQKVGQVFLQEQLLFDIFKDRKIKIQSIKSGKIILKERLCHKRVLLVLDDVNKLDQLSALCGSCEWFGSGSRIVITTRDKHILRGSIVDQVYTMKEINESESIELFSWHAFKQASPREDFAGISRNVVEYYGGLPLALEVVGSYLFDRSITEWKSVLEKLKRIPNDQVQKKLKISYEGLDDDADKKIFLDIASFFIGMDRNDVIQILEHFWKSAEVRMCVLEDQSLVTIDSLNRIQMHNLIRDMGKEIVRQKSMDMAEEAIIYDVFLSFRGEDCRAKFISHLYASLQNAGIYVFRDNDEIQRGDQISFSLLQAIRKSKISIIVLSKSYANSRWCMLELENIMESHRSRGLVVVPVFYEVDPSEVRHQTGEFGEAFKNLLSKVSVDEYTKKNWKIALLEVGGIAGEVIINSRNESDDIMKVVGHVTDRLDMTELFVAEHPVGIESRVQDVIQLLNRHQSKDPLLLGIWGMGGIGKTTIAKAVYNEIRRDFEAKSFLLNVREVWEQDNDKVSLQQRLVSDIYKTTKIKIDSIESGKKILQERLRQKRIFLVLDDVNKLDQLNALCGSHEWFGQGSRIIITTRHAELLSGLKVDHVYEIKVMDDNESLELFSWHAFKQPSPIEDFVVLSKDVVRYSGGLPLALQVIGSFLLTRRRKIEWKSVLEKLKIIPNDKVLEKLKISFDGLGDDDVKEIFLDIAFFFIGMDQEDVTKILKDCGHFPEIGISVLVQRSLITLDRKNKIGMHHLLRDMGRAIVNGGKEPSRLWLYNVHFLSSKDTRNINVIGVTLKLSTMDSTTYMETKAFEKMDKLRLLQLAWIRLDGDYKYLSRDLRWLCWHGFPLKYIPADFHQQSLVAVTLKYSNLKQLWKKSQLLEKLKILNLSHSHNLRQTPDFSNLPNLEKLILKDCPSLSSISFSIGQLKEILLINLKDCIGLCELPRSIYKLESLKTLILSGCTKIDKLEEDIEQMKSLTTLVADKTAITKVPFAVVRSKNIGYISVCGYEGFSRNVFPSIIQSWMSPTNNVFSLVQTSAGMSSLDFLDEQNGSFYGLSSIFKDLHNLQRLWLNCDSEAQLNQIEASILDNTCLEINCEELEAMPNTPQNSNVRASTSIIDCSSQVRISSSKTLLLIQIGMDCHVANIVRENILQKMPPIGSGLLLGDNYPEWLTFTGNGSSVTFEVPQVDGRNLKTIMCVVYSSSPDKISSEGLKVVMVINCTKNTILLCKRDALLAFSDEEEWQRVVSNAEPGDKVKVIVVFGYKFIVKKTTVYLIYDEPIDEETKEETEHYLEPNENINVSSGNDNIGDPKKKTKVSKGKNVHIDPYAEEDWSDGDQEKKEDSSTAFEHSKPDDSKVDSKSEVLTLKKAPTSKEDLPPPSECVKTEIKSSKGETQKPPLPERIRIKSLDSKSSSSPLPETPQKPSNKEADSVREKTHTSVVAKPILSISQEVFEKIPLSNQLDPMGVVPQGNDFDAASNVLNQEQEVETNLGFEEHQEKPQEENPKRKLEGSTESSPTKGPNEEKAPVSDPSYTPMSSRLPDFEELLVTDPATAMDKLLAGEFSHSSKTEQASSEPTSSHTSSNVLNVELQKLKNLVLQKKLLSLLLNDQEMKTEVNTLIDSIEAKLKDLTTEQYAGFIKFSKLFKTAITNIDASLKNKQQLMDTETEAKDATARLVVARKDMDRYKESITAGNKKLEEWNTEIPKIEAELQRIKEKLEHAKQEKNMLERLHPKLVEKQTEVLDGAKKLSKTVFTLQEKVAQYKQKEKELESEYVEFEADFKQLKDAFPF